MRRPLIADAVRTMQIRPRPPNLSIEEDLPPLAVNPDRIRQVLVDLLSNAARVLSRAGHDHQRGGRRGGGRSA